MRRRDRRVLGALQALVLGVPLLLGGRADWTLRLGLPLVLVLLVVTLVERRRRGAGGGVPGLAALAGFVALGLLTTLPLPPDLLGLLAPATADLYAGMLPGWPAAGGWTAWHPLALDPYAVWVELGRFALGFGVFAVVLAYPWESEAFGEDAETAVLGRLALTVIAGGALLAAVAFLQGVAGNGEVLWLSGRAPAQSGRASGPFVNPNHFAAWLEMALPLTLAYTVALAARLVRRLGAAAATGRRMGVPARRAWIAALIAHQERLWPPLAGAALLIVTGVAHVATGSRGGAAAAATGLGVTAAALLARRARGWRAPLALRALVPLGMLAALLATAGAFALWAGADAGGAPGAAAGVDPSLASRLAVAAQGRGVARDHLLFGTGLGSWLHAFRPYQAPPVEGGMWDHAHNDFLELAAESGLLGLALVLLFAAAVARPRGAAAGGDAGTGAGEAGTRAEDGPPAERRPAVFDPPEWRAALGDRGALRCGALGGIAAILVHGLVDFSLRMPANLLLLMTLAALVIVSRRQRAPARAAALPVLTALIAIVTLALAADAGRRLAGLPPLSADACLAAADVRYAADPEAGRADALALVGRALDRSPANREAHELHATVLGPDAEGDAALRRAVALSPWAPEVRDRLALRLWERGEHAQAAREIEEAMVRFPYLVSHAYLSPGSRAFAPRGPRDLVRALTDGETVALRVAALPPAIAAAVEGGLARALASTPTGATRASIVDDLVTVLESRAAWDEAARVLAAEGERSLEGGHYRARAARAYLLAGERERAETALLQALLDRPERGDLYRTLAVDVYAARGDFATAETVLRAGEQNAIDIVPVYRGTTEVLARRESARRRGPLAPACMSHQLSTPSADAPAPQGRTPSASSTYCASMPPGASVRAALRHRRLHALATKPGEKRRLARVGEAERR